MLERRLRLARGCVMPRRRVALLRTQKPLEGLTLDEHDEQVGVSIVRRALEEPIRQIANNAGVEPSILGGKVRENESRNFGYNARIDQYEDLVDSGMIGPARALQNAASMPGCC